MRQPASPLKRGRFVIAGARDQVCAMPHHFAVWLLRAPFVGIVMAALFWFVRRWPGGGGARPAGRPGPG